MLTGHVDNIQRQLVAGWAIDTDDLTATLEVMVFVDGHHRATVPCNAPRPDLKSLGHYGDGSHGFRYLFPAPLLDHREHRVFIAFKNNGCLVPSGHKLLLPVSIEREFQPVMVTAPGRSGTTLLMNRLGQQDEICIANLPPFELRLISYYAAAYRVLTSRSDPVRSTNPDHIEADRFFIGFNPFFDDNFEPAFSNREHFLSAFSGIIPDTLGHAFRNIILAFYRSLAYDQGKVRARYFAEKTNNIEQNVRHFARCIFGDIKELVLLRDPRDVYCSHLSYFNNDAEKSFKEISEACGSLLGIWNSKASDVLFVSYEDMILDQQRSFRAVADFLGMDILLPADHAREASIFSGHATSPSPHSSIGRWRHDLTEDQKGRCNETWRTFLQTFGYGDQNGSQAVHTACQVSGADLVPAAEAAAAQPQPVEEEPNPTLPHTDI